MASRRKSARPTNKVHQQLEIDEEDDEDANDTVISGIPEPGTITIAQTKMVSSQSTSVKMTALSQVTVANTADPLVTSQSLEPHIALPSDIYQDFETLKSVTKLGTTELMRKLLKDYQKMTSSSHASRERKLDDVIGDLMAARSSNILDLSKARQISMPNFDLETCGKPVSTLVPGYTDDQLAMGDYHDDDDDDENVANDDDDDDCKPLDLTLHKHELAPSPDSAIVEDINAKVHNAAAMSSVQTNSQTDDHTQIFQSYKPAGSYVINLDAPSSSVASSSLARVLQMEMPPQANSKIQNFSIGPPENLTPLQSNNILANARRASPTLPSLQGKILNQTGSLKDTKTPAFGSEKVANTPSIGGLPTYAEALSSVLSSNVGKPQQPSQGKSLSGSDSELPKNITDYPSNAVSFVHINAEDADIKFIPVNINTQLLPSGGSSLDQQKQQQHLQSHHQLLQKHLLQSCDQMPQQQQQTNIQPQQQQQQQQQQQGTLNTFCPNQIPQIHMLPLPGIKNEQVDSNTGSKITDLPFPNFLVDSQSVAVSAVPSVMSNVTMASNSVPLGSMSMPTFFMTATSGGGVGNMVAIPVIHALPEGMQPFAFAPHPVPPASSTSTAPAQNSSDPVLSTATSVSMASPVRSLEQPVTQIPELAAVNPTDSVPSPPPLPSSKPRPGRPRGRGGKGNSQKVQNKDMKLLTENTLFPGVYTSILKLPWSRRSRNKTKTKTISELKKQAQIIAHQKVNEDGDHFIGETENHSEDISCEQDVDKDSTDTRQVSQPQAAGHEVYNIETKLNPVHDLEMPGQQQQQQQQQQQHEQQRPNLQSQKQKDLEQQQRLHLQYHLRLQEEQRKLAKQIELSYMNPDTNPPPPPSVAVSTQPVTTIKQEIPQNEFSNEDSQNSPVLNNAGTPSPVTSIGKALQSNDSVMKAFSRADLTPSTKSPRKRGRPPKASILSSASNDNQSVIDVSATGFGESLSQSTEPDNFLLTATTSSTSTTLPTSGISVFDNSELLLNSMVTASEVGHLVPVTAQTSEEMELDVDNDMSLEKKITFLTNQIGLEMSKSILPQAPTGFNNMPQQSHENGPDITEEDNTLQNEIKSAADKSVVKPRRKKVSRLLKSDENFMYATFKIKPKGLTPRKSRRRRKDALASTAAAAETIATLRQKTLHDCLTSGSSLDSSKPPSVVAWKFHEQYPHSLDDVKDKRTACVTCGNLLAYGSDELAGVSRQCEACVFGNSNGPVIQDDHEVSENKSEDTDESELRAECCVNCGHIFQRHYSDPCTRCDTCRMSATTVIRSSKLFSFQDSPMSLPTATSTVSDTSKTGLLMSSPERTSMKESLRPNQGTAKVNNNHLYCSVCRMGFAKICDYLAHIRDTHDNRTEPKVPLFNDFVVSSDLTKKPRVSKTKKSLAHKTLTCPVEDCPHFFREQKDLELHFTKKHSKLGTCPHFDCGFSYSNAEELDNHLRYGHDQSTPPTTATTAVTSATTSGTREDETVTITDKTGSSSEKPLQCPFCDYRCRQKNALTWHMRKHPEAASQHRRYNTVNVD